MKIHIAKHLAMREAYII